MGRYSVRTCMPKCVQVPIHSGVAAGWTGVDMSTPLMLEVALEFDTNPRVFTGEGYGGRSAYRPPS